MQAATFDLGINISQQLLDANREEETVGIMEDDFSVWPVIAFRSEERYFGDSRLGYSLEFMAGTFDIDTQEVGGEQVDLDTSVRGYYAHLTPLLYYTFGNKKQNETKTGWKTTIGIGVGAGYLNVKGNMIMTEINSTHKENIAGDGLGFSVGVHLEFIKNIWFARVSNFSPVAEIGNNELQLHNISIIFGRRFDINIFEQK